MADRALTIIAHRGASALAPENTLAAFEAALALGVATIETDIRATRDGALVLCHDADLARLTGQPTRVAEHTLAELRRIVVGYDERGAALTIATPAELLDLVDRRARILFDMKIDTEKAGALFALLRERGAEGTAIIGVRSVAALAVLKSIAPTLATLAFGRTIEDVWALAEAGADIARLWSPWVTDEALARARQLGKPVWVMCGTPSRGDVGVTTLRELLGYRRRGIDGVLLNDPRLALAASAAD